MEHREHPGPEAATVPFGGGTVKRVRVKVGPDGAIRIPVTCNATAGCNGQLVIERASIARTAAGSGATTRRVIYGRARIAIPANRRRTVRIALSRRVGQALRGRRAIAALATVRFGGRTVVRRTITLRR